MAFSVVPQRFGDEFLPSKVEQRPQLLNEKNGAWMKEEKLHQAQMFISDDAPSTSCMQDMLKAKRSRFSFSSTPSMEGCSFPSRFDGSMTKRVRVDRILMAYERPWCCPDKFVLDCTWLVAEGGESTEVVSQKEREAHVFEAVYPCPSSIPFSPIEPEEICKDVDDSLLSCIPLIPVEDEENVKEDGSLGSSAPGAPGATNTNSCKSEKPTIPSFFWQPDTNSIKKSVMRGIACTDAPKHWQGSLSLTNADLNIAAAAAATYAAVRPLERSSNIDKELLFEILSSPMFSKSLISSNQTSSKKVIQNSPIANSNKMVATENHVSNGSSCTSRNLPSAFQGYPNSVPHLSRNVWHQNAKRVH